MVYERLIEYVHGVNQQVLAASTSIALGLAEQKDPTSDKWYTKALMFGGVAAYMAEDWVYEKLRPDTLEDRVK